MGVLVVTLMDKIAAEMNRREEIRPKMAAALEVFREMQAQLDRRSAALDQLVEWLSDRVDDRSA